MLRHFLDQLGMDPNQTMGGFGAPPNSLTHISQFQDTFHCQSFALAGKEAHDNGGKVILPQSVLSQLYTLLQKDEPVTFSLSNASKGVTIHAGALEFSAQEGHIYLPYWMMQILRLTEGQLVHVRGITLPKGKFIKFQAQSPDFLDISNPKAVLENVLRNFSAATRGDIIPCNYNHKTYYLAILETRPSSAISLVNTDVEVDFACPIGYKEPSPQPKITKQPTPPLSKTISSHQIPGAYTLTGRAKKIDSAEVASFLGGLSPSASSSSLSSSSSTSSLVPSASPSATTVPSSSPSSASSSAFFENLGKPNPLAPSKSSTGKLMFGSSKPIPNYTKPDSPAQTPAPTTPQTSSSAPAPSSSSSSFFANLKGHRWG